MAMDAEFENQDINNLPNHPKHTQASNSLSPRPQGECSRRLLEELNAGGVRQVTGIPR